MSESRAWIPAGHGLFALSETEVRGLLTQLEPGIQEAQNPAVASMMTIVEEIAGQWYGEVAAVEHAWEAHETAVADEERARKALVVVLRTLIELVGLHARNDRGPAPTASMCGADLPAAAARSPAVNVRRADPTVPQDACSAELAACLLGPFRLFRRGHQLAEWHGSKSSRVLRFLVARRGRSVPCDALIELFWPDADAECGRRNVHQMIYTIRKLLRGCTSEDDDSSEPPLVVFENDAYALNVQVGFWCDATEFEEHVAAGRRAEVECRLNDAMKHYTQAHHLYRGDFLEDLPYDEWVLADRRHLQMLYIETVNRLADARLDEGAVDEALELSERLLSCDPCDENAHRRMMRCYARSGKRGMLTQQYKVCADAMEQVLGLAPDRETVDLYSSLVNPD